MDPSDFSDHLRPIVLLPPPMEPAYPSFTYQRNQSVGYNLQQEFEALKADLDLDLSRTNDPHDDVTDSLSTSRNSGPAGLHAGASSISPALSATTGGGVSSGTSTSLTGGGSFGNVSNTASGTSGTNTGNTATISSTTISSSTNLSANTAFPTSGAANTASNQGTSSAVNSGVGSVTASLLSPSSFALAPTLSENLLRDRALSPGALPALLNKSSGFMPALRVPSRPQLVNEFLPFARAPTRFRHDVAASAAWLEALAPAELAAVLDHWCTHLPLEVLVAMRVRIDTHVPRGTSDYDDTAVAQPRPVGLVQPTPKATAFRHVFDAPRPKLADPAMKAGDRGFDRTFERGDRSFERVDRSFDRSFELMDRVEGLEGIGAHASERAAERGFDRFDRAHERPFDRPFDHSLDHSLDSPTAHLSEKTSFLQLAAGPSPHTYPGDDGLDAAKLGALATINSRVALDSRKHAARHDEIGRPQKYAAAAAMAPRRKEELPKAAAMPSEIASPQLLSNIPAWLKVLRLHKYTDCLKDMNWRDLVELDDQQLEDKGVKALGARRKLLKAFDTVKQTRAL